MTEPTSLTTDERVQAGLGIIDAVGNYVPNEELPEHPSNAGPPAEEPEPAEFNGTAQELETTSEQASD